MTIKLFAGVVAVATLSMIGTFILVLVYEYITKKVRARKLKKKISLNMIDEDYLRLLE